VPRAQGSTSKLGITKLPCIHVYAGEKIEDLVCGPSQFGGVRSAIENDLFCDPRATTPCEMVYDEALGPRPAFAVVPQGYTTECVESARARARWSFALGVFVVWFGSRPHADRGAARFVLFVFLHVPPLPAMLSLARSAVRTGGGANRRSGVVAHPHG
jgi:hypothetical protein